MKSIFAKFNTQSTEIYSHAIVWRNWAIVIAVVSLLIALIAIVSISQMLPLKENIPFLALVDHQHGEIATIRPMVDDELIKNEQLKKYMIQKFIVARERFDLRTYDEDARVVALLSDTSVYKDFERKMKSNHPDAMIDVGDINIIFLNENRAYVSFNLILSAETVYEIPMNADIKFHFSDRQMDPYDAQIINPVNFKVMSYQSHPINQPQEIVL